MNNSADEVAIALKLVYDQYAECAGRLALLIEYIYQQQGGEHVR